MMEEKINKMQGSFWMGFTVILAATLAINGVMALMGKANFAWWHLGTLAISAMMSWESLSAILIVKGKKTTKKAAKIHRRTLQGSSQPSCPFKNRYEIIRQINELQR